MRKTSEIIKHRIEEAGARYWAGDNIANFIMPEEYDMIIDELTGIRRYSRFSRN